MHTWIRSWHRAGTFTPPPSQLITNGVPGPTVTFDGRHWNAADGTIPGQTALFD